MRWTAQSISTKENAGELLVTWAFIELDEVGSTQAVAKGLASMGAAEGTTVVARSQTSGTGRLRRAWVSPVGGLYMSLILRPGGIPRPELVTLVSAVAVVQGIRTATGLAPTIRWPNDVMVNGKKLAGVIAEAQSYRQALTQVVVGIGVNCNSPVSRIDELKGEATSIREELGRSEEIAPLRHSILDSLSRLYEAWRTGKDMTRAWRSEVSTIGKRISVKLKSEETPFSCLGKALEEDGSLVVERADGETVIHAEELEWLRESA